MDRSSHSEASTVFRNKFPAVSDRAYFVSLFFLSKLLILLSTLYTFLQVTENKKSFFFTEKSADFAVFYIEYSIWSRGVEVAICSMIVKNLLTPYSKLLLVNCLVI